jgi:hypothetical protein
MGDGIVREGGPGVAVVKDRVPADQKKGEAILSRLL